MAIPRRGSSRSAGWRGIQEWTGAGAGARRTTRPTRLAARCRAAPSPPCRSSVFDRHAPVDTVLFGWVVARRLVIAAAVVPDDDVARVPLVAIRAVGLDHVAGQLFDQRVALLLLETFDADDLARVEVEGLASRLGVDADDRVEDRRPVTVLLVEQGHGLSPAAVRERALPPVEAPLEPLGERIVRRVHAREQRVTARARNGERVELGRLERLLVVRAVGVPSLGAPPIDRHVELAVGPELVDTEERDLGVVGVASHLRWMRDDDPEAAAVAQEVLDLELLPRHHDHVVVEPGTVDRGEAPIVERLDVDPRDLRADLRAEAVNLDHGVILLSPASSERGGELGTSEEYHRTVSPLSRRPTPSTYSANRSSRARAGSAARPAWTGELWSTSERGAVSQWKRSDGGVSATGPAAGSPATTAQHERR